MNSTFELARISNLLIPISRAISVEAAEEYPLLGIRLDGGGAFLREKKIGSQIAATTLFQVKKGDFIYSRLFAWRGAFGLIGNDLDGCFVSSEFPTFVPMKDKVDINFLQYWFRLSTTLSQVESNCTGSTPLTRNRFKEQFFLALEISLPPLTEQRRIVARIEELASRIEEARGLRREVMKEGNILLDSVLHHVFVDEEDIWTKAIVDSVAEIIDPNPSHRMPQYAEHGIPFISTVDFDGPETISRKTAKHVTEETYEEQQKRCLFAPGDILYSRIGTIGQARILTTVWPFALSHVLVSVKPKQDIILPRFLLWYLRSDSITIQAQIATRSMGVPDLGIKQIRSFRIPVSSLSEQQQIVNYLDNLQSKVYALKQLQAETTLELDALLPSVLDRAFKGEL